MVEMVMWHANKFYKTLKFIVNIKNSIWAMYVLHLKHVVLFLGFTQPWS